MKFQKKNDQVNNLPHRPMLREDKETTKIRAAFDASCALDGPSFNDYFYSLTPKVLHLCCAKISVYGMEIYPVKLN